MIKILLAAALSLSGCGAYAQTEVFAYAGVGTATSVSDVRYGVAFGADHRLSPCVMLTGGVRIDNRYPSGLGDVQAGVTIFPSRRSDRWSIANTVDFSNYAPYPMSQLYYRITAAWESRHFRIDFGNAFAFYMGSGVVKYHLVRPSFSLRGMVRGGDKMWDVALYIRNFNRFDAYGSKCVDWGGEVSARIGRGWRLYCEPFVTTVGNFNGTATFYNFNCHIGGSYRW